MNKVDFAFIFLRIWFWVFLGSTAMHYMDQQIDFLKGLFFFLAIWMFIFLVGYEIGSLIDKVLP